MAKAKLDIKTIQTEAERGLHATVGAADLVIEAVKDYVTDAQQRLTSVQQSVKGIDLQPRALRKQATSVVSERVDELSKDAKARRDAVEKRVADLQAEAQKFVSGNVETATDTYDDLVKRGETVVRRLRRDLGNQPAAKQTVANAKTTVAKAKTTNTQAKKTAKKVSSQAKKTTASVKKTAKKSPAVSSAKATGTAAKKTATSAAATVS